MGKRKPGGLSTGLFIVEYMDIFPLKSADKVPTARGMSIEMISSLLIFGLFIDSLPVLLYAIL